METENSAKEHVTPQLLLTTCISQHTIALFGDQWTPLVMYALESGGTQRFSQLRQRLSGISHKVLAQTLRAMERNGLVQRTVYPVIPPRVEYELTQLGWSLNETLWSLRRWATQHLSEVEQARAAYDRIEHIHVQDKTAALVEERLHRQIG